MFLRGNIASNAHDDTSQALIRDERKAIEATRTAEKEKRRQELAASVLDVGDMVRPSEI